MKKKIIYLIFLVIIIIGILFIMVYNFLLNNCKHELSMENSFMNSLQKEKIQDYLYYITANDYDYNEGQTFLNSKYDIKLGGCSSVRNGDFFGRNYDWYYEDIAEFVIRVPKKNNRHASIGMAYSGITNEQANSNEYLEGYFLTSDGINDDGVAITINVVPTGDKGYTIGTNPNGENLMTLMIPRYILDNAGSVDEAINLLKIKIYILL